MKKVENRKSKVESNDVYNCNLNNRRYNIIKIQKIKKLKLKIIFRY